MSVELLINILRPADRPSESTPPNDSAILNFMRFMMTFLNARTASVIAMVFYLYLVQPSCMAALSVKMDSPKQIGKKVIIKMVIKNTFQEKVESARAQIFLLDDKGKVVGQAVRWVIGGTKDKPALAPDAETMFNFVVETDKSFATNKVTFTRVILEGGKLVDPSKSVEMQN